MLVFGFGLAAGLLIAVAGSGMIEDRAGLILTVLLAAFFVVAVVGGLILHIVSASRAARPCRFLDTGLLPDDPSDRMRVAMSGRREVLPQA